MMLTISSKKYSPMPLSYLAFPLDGSSHLPTLLNNCILPFVFFTKCLAHCHLPLWYTHFSYYYILFYFPKAQDGPEVENRRTSFMILALACSVTLDGSGITILFSAKWERENHPNPPPWITMRIKLRCYPQRD